MKTSNLLLLFIGVIILQSCNVINPDEDVPSYIYIEAIEFEGELTDRHKITEVWVFDDGTMLGAFDLPAEIPILKTGNVAITFRAGIKNNGISSTRILYPFYDFDVQTLNLVAGERTNATPVFETLEDLSFPSEAIATFEGAGTNYGEATGSIAEIVTTQNPDNVLDGNGSGYVKLDTDKPYWKGKSLGSMQMPFGEFAFLEFNYKCSNSFGVGLRANSNASNFDDIEVIMKSTEDENGIPQWNKIYIDLGGIINVHTYANSFNVLFEANLESSESEGEIWLDNIFVVHFD